jgi:hypothetical protein
VQAPLAICPQTTRNGSIVLKFRPSVIAVLRSRIIVTRLLEVEAVAILTLGPTACSKVLTEESILTVQTHSFIIVLQESATGSCLEPI